MEKNSVRWTVLSHGIGTLYGDLISIQLSTLQLVALSLAPLLLGLLYLLLRSREKLVSVTAVPRSHTLIGDEVDGPAIPVRHDALAWTSTRFRRRNSKARVEIPGSHEVWIPERHIVDTGY